MLRSRQSVAGGGREPLADLLARHGRVEELRAYAEVSPLVEVTRCLSELLEARGDLDGAIEVYREAPNASVAFEVNSAAELSQLLQRHGRAGEALEVIRMLAESPHGDDWSIHLACVMYLEQDRAGEGLAFLDACEARHPDAWWDFSHCVWR